MSAPTKPDPYTAFKDDRERRIALMSRDIRLLLCTAVVVIFAPQIVPAVMIWLWRLAKMA